ncbi:FkbM family methyltransferase, partial [Helicobacter marmotae]
MVLRFKFWLKGKLPSKCWQWLVWAKAKCKGRAIYRHASYSIEGEDRILSALMGDKEGKSGFYVDVGAHHPFRYSNTYLFYTWGWMGINIDATPGSMAAFRKHRPRDINIECAIGNVIADNKESQAFSSPLVRGNTAPCSKSCKETPPEILTTFQVCHVLGKARLIEESLLKTPKSTTSDSKSNSSGFQALRHDNRDRVAGDSNRDSS